MCDYYYAKNAASIIPRDPFSPTTCPNRKLCWKEPRGKKKKESSTGYEFTSVGFPGEKGPKGSAKNSVAVHARLFGGTTQNIPSD